MKMKLNNCKLKKNTQLRLLEYFLLEVTARSAANLLDISQIRQLFSIKRSGKLAPFIWRFRLVKFLMVVLNLMRAILAVCSGVKEEEVRLGK
jgi:hypothetical protein